MKYILSLLLMGFMSYGVATEESAVTSDEKQAEVRGTSSSDILGVIDEASSMSGGNDAVTNEGVVAPAYTDEKDEKIDEEVAKLLAQISQQRDQEVAKLLAQINQQLNQEILASQSQLQEVQHNIDRLSSKMEHGNNFL